MTPSLEVGHQDGGANLRQGHSHSQAGQDVGHQPLSPRDGDTEEEVTRPGREAGAEEPGQGPQNKSGPLFHVH